MNHHFKAGDQLLCLANRSQEDLLPSHVVCVALTDTLPGIFADRPYITVTSARLEGRPVTAHASRFIRYDGSELTPERIEELKEQFRGNIHGG
ncbi:hypothetical protein [Larsenimonas suaedae]|uniref:Type II toxin-antitoxin system PemK/MazF family toxin n=1 Tax=Larsenimonas suaedae TaxID=1851019 RepID=A0ABU1GZ80_9GAMM|nr:hypothetical protein [Larsenimonas suaedae]MCM2973755.1 hypothetical protein [Larsenimonas suaedae]MDR5897279.1 hypothetical protein [Larsenimonas suaedae]